MWKIKYLKALNLKGLEGRTGTAYEVVERVMKKIEKNLEFIHGEMVEEIKLFHNSFYLWHNLENYQLPQPKLIKYPRKN